MLRKVLKDCRDGFRWSRFKEICNFSMLWSYVYLLTFFPIIMHLNEKTERLGRYFIMMFPMLLGMYSLLAIPIRLPKQMFLCPLTEKERKQYVKTLFMVRFAVPVLVSVLTYSVSLIFGWLDADLLWIQFAGLFSFLLCGSITNRPGSTWERTDTGKNRLKNPKFRGLSGISGTGLISAVFLQMINALGWYSGEADIFLKISIIVLGMVTIVCDVLVLRYLEPVIDMNIDYENSYNVKSQKQKA